MKKTILFALITLGIGVVLYFTSAIISDVVAYKVAIEAAKPVVADREVVASLTSLITTTNVIGLLSIALSSLVLVAVSITKLFRSEDKK